MGISAVNRTFRQLHVLTTKLKWKTHSEHKSILIGKTGIVPWRFATEHFQKAATYRPDITRPSVSLASQYLEVSSKINHLLMPTSTIVVIAAGNSPREP